MAEAVDHLLTGTASAAQLARLLDLSPRSIRELAERGIIPRDAGRYRLPDAVHGYVRHLREVAAGRKSEHGDDALDLVQERAALARSQRQLAELKLQRERGELVEVVPVRNALVAMIVRARNQLMSVPPRAKGRLPHLTIDDIEVLENMIVEALESLAADPRLFGPADADSAHDAGDGADEL